MKDVYNNITKKLLNTNMLVAAIVLALLASCTSTEDPTDGNKVLLYPVISTGIQPVIETRGTVTVNNATGTYSDSNLGNGAEIRVYAVPVPDQYTTAQDFDNLKIGGTFRRNNNEWYSSVAVIAEHDYRLFGFAASAYRDETNPTAGWALPGASNQTFNWGLTGNSYSAQNFDMDNVAVNFTNLDVLTTMDPLVCIASSFQKYDSSNPQASVPVTAPTLTKGTFQVARTEITGNSSNLQFRVWMALDHLLSKATVSFCVDTKYAEIRDIRLKEAKLVIDKTKRSFRGNHSYSFKDGFIPDPNASFGNISQDNTDDLEIYLLGGDDAVGPFDEGEDYSTLTTSYREYASFCFLPVSYLPDDEDEQTPQLEYPDVTLKVKYDVYKKDPDNETPVRLQQEAQNSFSLSSFTIGAGNPMTPKAGDHFRIKVKVKPTYLYQMHDDDGQIELSIE